jgi:hypothetical protein
MPKPLRNILLSNLRFFTLSVNRSSGQSTVSFSAWTEAGVAGGGTIKEGERSLLRHRIQRLRLPPTTHTTARTTTMVIIVDPLTPDPPLLLTVLVGKVVVGCPMSNG